MKKIINAAMAFLSVLFLAFGIFSEAAKAIDPDSLCTPCDSCEEFHKPYSGSYSYSLDSSGHALWAYNDSIVSTCYYEVYFKIRRCWCPIEKKEIFIEKIEVDSSCSSSIEDILTDAIKQLISRTPDIFYEPLLYPWGGWNVSVMYNKCWQWDSTFIVPCEHNSECCKTRYWVGFDSTGCFITEVQKDSLSGLPCSPMLDCFDYCDANFLTEGPIITSTSEEICNDSCPSIQWNDASVYFENYEGPPGDDEFYFEKAFVKFYGNDHVTVYVSTKECNDRKYIRIERILLNTSMPGITDYEFLYRAVEGALWRSHGYFKEYLNDDSLGPKQYIVIMSSCWERINERWIIPCPGSECCFVEYDVEIEEEDPIVFPPYYRKEASFDEGPDTPDSCSAPCSYQCMALTEGNITSGYLKRTTRKHEDLKLETNRLIKDVVVKPNPTESSFKVELNPENEGIYKISVYSLGGTKYYTNFRKTDSSFSWVIDTRSWPVGTYYIQITQNGRQYYSDKIIINR